MVYNEYNLPELNGTVSMTKIKNLIKKDYPHLEPHLSNIRINGQLRGCSGFLVDTNNNRIAYINTEASAYSPRGPQALIRNARHLKDYSGLRNRFVPLHTETIVSSVSELLKSDDLA